MAHPEHIESVMNAPITAASARAYAAARAAVAPAKGSRPFVGMPVSTLALPVTK